MALHDDDGEPNGQSRLALVPLEWDDEGLPVLRW